MFQKDMKNAYLLDFYGEVLDEHTRSILRAYYEDDLSLAEIAEEIGISRQGVRDIIKKTESELFFYEEKLGLAARLLEVEARADALCRLAEDHSLPDHIRKEIIDLAAAVKQS